MAGPLNDNGHTMPKLKPIIQVTSILHILILFQMPTAKTFAKDKLQRSFHTLNIKELESIHL